MFGLAHAASKMEQHYLGCSRLLAVVLLVPAAASSLPLRRGCRSATEATPIDAHEAATAGGVG